MRRLAPTALVLLAIAAASASADGPGGPGVGSGLVAPGGRVSYTTSFSAKSKHTRIAMWSRTQLLHTLRLDGSYGIPIPVALGGAAALSHDGATLVLARMDGRGFAVVDARTLRLRRTIALAGSFSYDALSPSGRMLYLIQYLVTRGANHYYVRAYDVAVGRLDRQIVFDVREPDEPMTGVPVTRTTGPTGRWVYTLYSRSAGTAFVHALDTVDRHAFCIDLPGKRSQAQVFLMRLRVRPGRVLVTANWATRPLAAIDTRTLRLTKTGRP